MPATVPPCSLADPALRGPIPAGSRAGQRAGRGRRRMLAVLGGAVLVVLCVVLAHADPRPSPSPGPTASAPATRAPSTVPSPCASSPCAPQPGASAPSAPPPEPAPNALPSPSASNIGSGSGGMTGWIAGAIVGAVNSFFKGVVTAALNPLLDLLGKTLLTTPTPDSLPRIGELWNNSWAIAVACYALLVTIAGVVVMAHETAQTRYSIKEMAARIPLGFIAAALSLFLAGQAITIANALSEALMGPGVEENSAATTLRNIVLGPFNALNNDFYLVLLGGVLAGILVALLVTYAVRVALTVMLIAGAPIALMCHALPQTDGIARWWWKSFGGVLAIQIVQSVALITALRVFLAPGGFTLFGPTPDGLVNIIVALGLMYILFKIPFWILNTTRLSNRRSFASGLVRTYVMAKTFGALRHATGGAHPRSSRIRPSSGPPPQRGGLSPAPGGPRPRPPKPPRTPMRPPGPPLFLSPAPASSATRRATGRAAGPPSMPVFQAPGSPPGGPGHPPASPPRPPGPPGPPTFRAASSAPPLVLPPRRGAPPGAPMFRQPNPRSAPQPRRASGPPAPGTFLPPVPNSSPHPMRRTGLPPLATFSSPPAAANPPRKRTPAPPPHRDKGTGGDRR